MSKPAAKKPTTSKAVTKSASTDQPMLGDLKIVPISLATFLLLEKIDSPFMPGKEAPIKLQDMAAAVLILTNPNGAQAALAIGQAEFDRLAFVAVSRVPASDLTTLSTVLAAARPR